MLGDASSPVPVGARPDFPSHTFFEVQQDPFSRQSVRRREGSVSELLVACDFLTWRAGTGRQSVLFIVDEVQTYDKLSMTSRPLYTQHMAATLASDIYSIETPEFG